MTPQNLLAGLTQTALTPRTRRVILTALICALCASGAGSAHAAIFNWVASPTDGLWGTAANWDTGTVPNATDSQVVFSNSAVTTLSLNNPNPTPPPTSLAADKTLQSITFSGLDSFTINAGGVIYLRHSDGIFVAPGTPGQTFNAELRPSISGAAVYNVVNNGSGLLALGTLNSSPGTNATMVFDGTGDTRVSQLVRRYANQATNLGLVKNGPGTLTILGAYASAGNARGDATSYGYSTGTTVINGGTISISAEGNLGGNPGDYWTYVGGVDILNPGAFNPAALTLNGGALRATASFAIDDPNRGVTLGASGGTFEVSAGQTLTVANPVAGAGALTKTGAGTLTLSGANSYAGTTTINAGVLSIAAVGNLGSGAIVLGGGTLRTTGSGGITVNRSITLTANSVLDTQNSGNTNYTGVISDGAGTFGFTKIGGSNLILSGNNTYDGETVLTGGSTYINKNTSLGSTLGGTTVTGTLTLESAGMNVAEPLTLNGTLRMYPGSGSATYSGPITLTADGTFAAKIAGTTFDISGSVGGNFGLTINNEPGTVRLSGLNTYTGTTSVRQSTLLIGANAPSGAPGALGNATSAVNLGIGGTPAAENLALLTDGAFTVGRDIVVGNQNTTGTTTLGGRQTAGASTYSGAVTLNHDVILTSANTDANAVTFSGPISGTGYGITKMGPGTVVLAGTNSYTGTTTVSEGVLSISSAGNLGSGGIVLGGGTLRSTGSTAFTVSRPITLTANSFFDTRNGGNTSYSGVISDGAGVFGFTKIGANSLLLYGNNSYDGETILSQGTTYLFANNTLGTAAGATTLASGATLSVETNYTTPETLYLNGGILRTSSEGSTRHWWGDVVLGAESVIRAKNLAAVSTLVINGSISGDYGLRVGDGEPGVVVFNGNSTYTGATSLRQGTLVVDGSIASSSAIEVRAGTTLKGHGAVPAIWGAGLVSPGNSPGILTAPSVDPLGGLDFDLQFNAPGSPDYGNPAASVNDVLRLTHASAPFAGTFQAGNVIDIYLNVTDLDVGDAFRGGFYTDLAQDFTSWIDGATLNFYVALDGNGPEVFEGVGYYPLSGTGLVPAMAVQTVPETADFGGGPVSGFVMQLTAVPEPSTLVLAALGFLAVGLLGRQRRMRG